MKYRKQAHCLYHCEYHIVISTKYRRKIFNDGVFAFIRKKLEGIRKHYPELVFVETNHDRDHIHLLLSVPPKMSISSVVRIIKANTSRGIKQSFPFLKKVYWGTDGIWSDGYFVSTVGIDNAVIRKYIEHQGEEDSGQAELEL
ncbi:MAG: IS200/IS605 family transposase [Hyphomicrobiales bacterium]|nr:IS200/IS605 family transposase [Rickettsiales bacterium]MCP5361193.1 IS200/IS605 family transposase [Hyphomicrobiales bacterium]MCP5361462.1 IS200/IS605 family transposase [Hyphomicrobiales bacterium]